MKRLLVLMLVCALLRPPALAQSTAIANPWREVTAEVLMDVLGVHFGVPEGAENIVYLTLEAEKLAEMQFELQGVKYCARIKPTAEFEDISGLFYLWDAVEDCEIGWCAAKILCADADENAVRLCLWYDAAPGLMYSLSAMAPTDAPIDLADAAASVYLPTQGEVGPD